MTSISVSRKSLSLLACAAFTIAGTQVPESAAQNPPAMPPREVAEPALEELFGFLPEVVATCDDNEITASQIRDALPPQLVVMVANGFTPKEEELRQVAIGVAQQLINEKILLSKSAEAGYTPQTEEGQQRVAEIEEKVGDENFAAGLKHQGLTREQLVERIARQVAVSKWIDEKILPQIDVSDEKLSQVYEENKEAMRTPEQVEASHILVKVEPDADAAAHEAAQQKAAKLREQIVEGADFAELAEMHSDCPSAKNGGNLGNLRSNDTVPEFSTAAFALEKDEISDVVKTQFGYHIIQSHGKTEARLVPFEEAAEQLRNAVRQNELNAALEQVVNEAREKADIKILIPQE